MTKGRYGKRAANREAAVHDQLAPYQRKVAALTAENKQLKELAREKDKSHAAEVRRLRIERNEGIAPALVVAQKEASKMREERDKARAELRSFSEIHEKFLHGVVEHFVVRHHMTRTEALTQLLRMLPDVERNALVRPSELTGKGISHEGLERIMRAKGWLTDAPEEEEAHS